MKRGPQPAKGVGPAIQLAERRGLVMVFQPSKKNIATFVIVGNGMLTIVSVLFTEKLWPDISEIESRFRDAIVALGLVPYTGPVSRELWLYNRHGTIRKFRLGPAGLIEITESGFAAGPEPPGSPGSRNSGQEISGPDDPAGTGQGHPGTLQPADPVAAAKAEAHGLDPRSPIARWLLKRNTAIKPAPGPAINPDSGEENIPGPGKSPVASGEPVPVPEDLQEGAMPGSDGVPVTYDISHLSGRYGIEPR